MLKTLGKLASNTRWGVKLIAVLTAFVSSTTIADEAFCKNLKHLTKDSMNSFETVKESFTYQMNETKHYSVSLEIAGADRCRYSYDHKYKKNEYECRWERSSESSAMSIHNKIVKDTKNCLPSAWEATEKSYTFDGNRNIEITEFIQNRRLPKISVKTSKRDKKELWTTRLEIRCERRCPSS